MQPIFWNLAARILIALEVLVAGPLTSAQRPPQQPLQPEVCTENSELGFVSKIHGSWMDQKHSRPGNQPLHTENLICEDSELVQQAPFNATDAIAIRLRNGDEKSYSCKEATVCPGPFRLPAIDRPKSGFLESLLLLLNRQPLPAKALFMRGGSLEDSIVLMKSGRVDLGPALRYASRGTYVIGFCMLDTSTTQGESPCKSRALEQKIAVNGDLTEPIAAPSLKAGLYQLEMSDPTAPSEAGDQSSEAWIVVAQEKSWSRLKQEYETAQNAVAQWNMSSGDASSLLRLYLIGLAQKAEQ